MHIINYLHVYIHTLYTITHGLKFGVGLFIVFRRKYYQELHFCIDYVGRRTLGRPIRFAPIA